MRGRLAGLCVAVLGLGLVGALLVGAGPLQPPAGAPDVPVQTAADTSSFDPGNIISDAVFFAGRAMDANEIQSFLSTKGATCVAGSDGTPCLKDYRQDTTTRAADSYCSGYSGAAGESASVIIAKSAIACGVSPRVLLVVLQKEQGLVTGSGSGLNATRYQKAMGFACPDTAACDATYYGFQNQVYSAARQYVRYAANPNGYAYRAGRTVNVLFNPNSACGSAPVTIANQATAGLYIYTPYQPNAAALAAGYARGDDCSAYGNRNFWLYFTDWFGSTQVENAAATMPRGALDAVTSSYGQVTVSGWTMDPDRISQSLAVHAYVDGQPVVAISADRSRPDVAAAFPGAGDAHGFSSTFPTSLGVHQVCVYAINIGAGTVNPQLGCRTVDNQDPGAPVGAVEALATQPGSILASGWTFDPDVPAASLDVRAYVDGVFAGRTTAGVPRPDVGAAYGVGAAHGFSLSITVSPGPHQVCIYAINQGLGSTNPTLACSTMTVENPKDYDPVGLVDSVVANGGTVSLGGWVYDKDIPTAPVTVHIAVDGSVITAVSTNQVRPDVAAVVPGVGTTTGYSWSGVVPAGRHQICVFAINTGFGTTNPLLGCRIVNTVGGAAANPIGTVEQVAAGSGELIASGWAFDADAPTSPVTVHVYVDGSPVAAVSADGPRPDVARAVGVGDVRRGWSWRGTATAGRHQVCLFAINTGAGNANPLLGCLSVTVSDPNVGRDPIGTVDSVSAASGAVTVSGWAYDPDAPTTPVAVHVYVDGAPIAAVAAGADRPDVAAAIPGAGIGRGYTWSGPVTSGVHQVCVFAINTGLGTGNPLLGCRSVTAP